MQASVSGAAGADSLELDRGGGGAGLVGCGTGDAIAMRGAIAVSDGVGGVVVAVANGAGIALIFELADVF